MTQPGTHVSNELHGIPRHVRYEIITRMNKQTETTKTAEKAKMKREGREHKNQIR